MRAAEALMRTAARAGVDVCFANPGTTEMPLVAALDAVPGVRAVLGLFEGVCSAAADGFARMSGRPALTLLHLGPGFANGIANFHNAARARSPVLNLIGDHATGHRVHDAPLASDIESLARPVSRWLGDCVDPARLAQRTAEAIAAARQGGVATLVVPHDVQLGEAAAPARVPAPPAPPAVPGARVDAAAQALRSGEPAALYLGGSALSARGLRAAARLVAHTGCHLLCDTFPARLERGAGTPVVERLAYFPEPALQQLARFRELIFVGARPPVSFFGYAGIPSCLAPETARRLTLAEPEGDAGVALEALASALGAPTGLAALAALEPPPRPTGRLTPERVAAQVAAALPEQAILVDEGLTAGAPLFERAAHARPHTHLALTGGAIGQGLPSATGAALACPERPVLALQADGSGLYTLQALWTQAREGLHVTSLVLANRGYRILEAELARSGQAPGPVARRLMDFGDAAPDWVRLAAGFGVSGVRVEDCESLGRALEQAFAEPGPHLVEALL